MIKCQKIHIFHYFYELKQQTGRCKKNNIFVYLVAMQFLYSTLQQIYYAIIITIIQAIIILEMHVP